MWAGRVGEEVTPAVMGSVWVLFDRLSVVSSRLDGWVWVRMLAKLGGNRERETFETRRPVRALPPSSTCIEDVWVWIVR